MNTNRSRSVWLRAALVLALLIGTGALGCSTHYTPKPAPRLSMTMQGGEIVYVRDGQEFEAGLFGSGLVDAVADVPEAREHAESYRDLSIAGFFVAIPGALAAGLGAGLAVGNELDEPADETIRAVSLSLAFGGLAMAIVGVALAASGQPHFFDAINIYNDAVSPPTPPAPLVPATADGYLPGQPPWTPTGAPSAAPTGATEHPDAAEQPASPAPAPAGLPDQSTPPATEPAEGTEEPPEAPSPP